MEPYFFQKEIPEKGDFALKEDSSKHCIQVLRMSQNDRLRLTDGKGNWILGVILNPDKKHCQVRVLEHHLTPQPKTGFSIAIAFTKSKDRNEWLLEKLTEIGTTDIYPILTQNSERVKYNVDRYEKILISALLQSQQTRLPRFHELQKLAHFWENTSKNFLGEKLIAHCEDTDPDKFSLLSRLRKDINALILIGPEGDFSLEEIENSKKFGFKPVHLGKNRLRTETAAVYACTVFNAFQDA